MPDPSTVTSPSTDASINPRVYSRSRSVCAANLASASACRRAVTSSTRTATPHTAPVWSQTG